MAKYPHKRCLTALRFSATSLPPASQVFADFVHRCVERGRLDALELAIIKLDSALIDFDIVCTLHRIRAGGEKPARGTQGRGGKGSSRYGLPVSPRCGMHSHLSSTSFPRRHISHLSPRTLAELAPAPSFRRSSPMRCRVRQRLLEPLLATCSFVRRVLCLPRHLCADSSGGSVGDIALRVPNTIQQHVCKSQTAICHLTSFPVTATLHLPSPLQACEVCKARGLHTALLTLYARRYDNYVMPLQALCTQLLKDPEACCVGGRAGEGGGREHAGMLVCK